MRLTRRNERYVKRSGQTFPIPVSTSCGLFFSLTRRKARYTKVCANNVNEGRNNALHIPSLFTSGELL